MRAAVGRRDGVAVGTDEAVGLAEADRRPGHGPFDGTGLALAFDPAGEGRRHGLELADPLGQGVGQTVGEVEDGLGRRLIGDPLGRAGPADLDAAEQIGLGAGHAEQAGGLECRADAEDFLVRLEPDQGALFLRGLDLDDGAQRQAAAEGLFPLEAVAPDGDVEPLAQGIDDRDADAVQTARGFIGFTGELPARMEDGHDHFQRRLARVFGVGIDRNAAPVVLDRQPALGVEVDGDQFRMAGHGLVHRIVQNLGEQVVQGPLISAADIHAGAFADRLQPLQHLDRGGGVVAGQRRRGRGGGSGAHGLRLRPGCDGLRCQGRVGHGRVWNRRRCRALRLGHIIEQGRRGVGTHTDTVRRFGDRSGRPGGASPQAGRGRQRARAVWRGLPPP